MSRSIFALFAILMAAFMVTATGCKDDGGSRLR